MRDRGARTAALTVREYRPSCGFRAEAAVLLRNEAPTIAQLRTAGSGCHRHRPPGGRDETRRRPDAQSPPSGHRAERRTAKPWQQAVVFLTEAHADRYPCRMAAVSQIVGPFGEAIGKINRHLARLVFVDAMLRRPVLPGTHNRSAGPHHGVPESTAGRACRH